MNLEVKLSCVLILASRLIDLYSTYISMVDFKSQETNILVKYFNLNFWEFCIVDILLAFLLIGIFLFSVKKSFSFKINANSLMAYSKIFLYKKEYLNVFEYMYSMSFKRVLILFGSITPKYIFSTSLIFSLNNFWVYLFITNNKSAISSYNLLNSYYFFDFIIYVLPVILLLYFTYKKLKNEFDLYNKS